MKQAVAIQEQKENMLQQKYYNLKCEKEKLEKMIQAIN